MLDTRLTLVPAKVSGPSVVSKAIAATKPSTAPYATSKKALFTVPKEPTPNPAMKVPFADVPLEERLAWDEKQIKAYGTQMAKACLLYRTVLTDAVFTLTPPGKSKKSAFLRACKADYWQRQCDGRLMQEREHAARVRGEVGANAASQCVSNDSAMRLRRKDEKNAKFLKQAILASETLGRLPLMAVANTAQRKAADYYARLAGIEACANRKAMRWAMLTITLPPAFHANPASGKRSEAFNLVKVAEANRRIAKAWAKLRAQLLKHDIKLAGVHTCEGMADGTPHWHVAFFYTDQAELAIICAGILRQYPEGLRIRETYFDKANRLQSSYRQYNTLADFTAGNWHTHIQRGAVCQLDIGAAKTGDPERDKQVRSCTGYVLKYVLKSLGDSEVIQARADAEAEKRAAEDKRLAAGGAPAPTPVAPAPSDEPTQAELAAAFTRIHRLRAVGFFGIPRGIVTAWKDLRRIRLPLDGKRPKGVGLHTFRLATLCQSEKGAGFEGLLHALGGLASQPETPTYVVQTRSEPGENDVGEKTTVPVGLTVTHVPSGAVEYYPFPNHGFRLFGYPVALDAIDRAKAAQTLGKPQLVVHRDRAVLSSSLDERPQGAERSAVWSASDLVILRLTVTCIKLDLSNPIEVEANAAQRLAIEAPLHAHHVVFAAAGSGKTHLLVERAAYLVAQGLAANDVVLTTFTTEAAKEMRNRLDARGLTGVQVGTMHSLSARWGVEVPPGGAEGESYDQLILASTAKGKKNKHLLVDEAQDLSEAQWDWVAAHARSTFVVGDSRQAIYGWRGASASGMFAWAKRTGAVQSRLVDISPLVHLPHNRRSGSVIVELGNRLAPDELPAQAIHDYGTVSYVETDSEKTELAHIAAFVQAATGTCGIIARTNKEVNYLASNLLVMGIDVPVMTIHESKGQEFDSVVLACGARKPSELGEDAEQVFYVAVTRAKSELLITSQGWLPPRLYDALIELEAHFLPKDACQLAKRKAETDPEMLTIRAECEVSQALAAEAAEAFARVLAAYGGVLVSLTLAEMMAHSPPPFDDEVVMPMPELSYFEA